MGGNFANIWRAEYNLCFLLDRWIFIIFPSRPFFYISVLSVPVLQIQELSFRTLQVRTLCIQSRAPVPRTSWDENHPRTTRPVLRNPDTEADDRPVMNHLWWCYCKNSCNKNRKFEIQPFETEEQSSVGEFYSHVNSSFLLRQSCQNPSFVAKNVSNYRNPNLYVVWFQGFYKADSSCE